MDFLPRELLHSFCFRSVLSHKRKSVYNNYSDNEIHQLNRLAAMTAQYSCQGCSHLCEKAVNNSARIADSLRYLMYHECYGKRDVAKEFYQQIPINNRSLTDQETTIAQSMCPQGIDIKSRLELAQRILAS